MESDWLMHGFLKALALATNSNSKGCSFGFATHYKMGGGGGELLRRLFLQVSASAAEMFQARCC